MKLRNWLRNRWLWLGLAVILAGGIWWHLRSAATQTDQAATRVVRPQRGTITEVISVSGVISPGTQVDIYPQVNSAISALLVEKGDRVKKGQVIARLDPTDLLNAKRQAAADLETAQARLAQAEANLAIQEKESASQNAQARANLASAEAKLSQLKAGSKPQEVAQAEASLRQARINLEVARQEASRQKLLYENGAISRQEYETAQTKLRLSQEDVYAAEQKLELLRSGSDPAEIRMAQAQVDQARAALRGQNPQEERRLRLEDVRSARAALTQAQIAYQKAQQDLEATVIRSPMDGVVLDVPVKQGSVVSVNNVSSNTLIATIADLTRPEAQLYVNEADIAKVKVGLPAKIKIEALGGEWDGQVSRIEPQATVNDNVVTFAVNVAFLDPPANIKAGLTADVDIIVGKKENVLWLPTFAIRSQGERAAVMVKKGDKVVPRQIEIGISDGYRTEIRAGLQGNEEVVLGGGSFSNSEKGVNNNSSGSNNRQPNGGGFFGGPPPGTSVRQGGSFRTGRP